MTAAQATSPSTSSSASAGVHEPVHFYSDGLRLSGQFTRAVGATPGTRSPTIVCLHGYTGRKEIYMPGYVRELSAAGFNTLDFHHRGFGESEGVRLRNKPWDQVADVLSALIYLRQRPEVDPGRIGLYGTSFGGSVGMMATAHDDGIRCAVSVGSSAHCGRSSHDKRTYSERLDWEDLMAVDRVERVMTGQSRRVPYDVLVPSGPEATAESTGIEWVVKRTSMACSWWPLATRKRRASTSTSSGCAVKPPRSP